MSEDAHLANCNSGQVIIFWGVSSRLNYIFNAFQLLRLPCLLKLYICIEYLISTLYFLSFVYRLYRNVRLPRYLQDLPPVALLSNCNNFLAPTLYINYFLLFAPSSYFGQEKCWADQNENLNFDRLNQFLHYCLFLSNKSSTGRKGGGGSTRTKVRKRILEQGKPTRKEK